MSKTIIPANYTPALNLYDTQRAIGTVKRLFADTLCATLNLYRVSAPLFVEASTGLNDGLNCSCGKYDVFTLCCIFFVGHTECHY